LQEKEISRVGSNKVQSIDVRVICATHRNLTQEVRIGKFREDLYYRLLGLPIALPPLRERNNDVLILAKAFLTEFCKDNGMPVKALTDEAKKKLVNYHWPGNVRELRATIELATVLSDRDKIDADSINFDIKDGVSDVVFEEGTLKDYTRKIIKFFLEKYDNNVVEVAKRLDIGKSTIYRMIKDKELEV
jgi:two-component system, NtrC family, response regulator AtoC